ncbi:transcriptional regulator [Saccharibacillus sp. O16]|nr:transcriptional regulator [Saccharibacillus sp. O16]
MEVKCVKRVWLLNIRSEKEMTHEQVAELAGIKRQYYGMIENGVSNPSVEVAKSIATALDFDWPIFFEDKSNKTLHKASSKEVG